MLAIFLVGSNSFYVIHMHDDGMGDYPFMYPVSLEELPPEIQSKQCREHL